MNAEGMIEKEVWKRFADYETVMLATAEGDQPRVRPVTLIRYESAFWVATGTDSVKTAQISANPKVEFCLSLNNEAGNGYVRVAGKAELVADHLAKERLARHIEFFADYWSGPDDPTYSLIRISPREVEYLRPGEMLARRFLVREAV